jgi:hypothetical protein
MNSERRIAYFNGEPSPLLSLAAEFSGYLLSAKAPSEHDRSGLELRIDEKRLMAKSVFPSGGGDYTCRVTPDHLEVTAATQAGLAYSLLDEAESEDDLKSVDDYEPALALRSYHMWFPFALGQAYGGQGYSAWEMRTDWWWYDESFWTGFLQELALARYNMIVFWHTHPHPGLIAYDEYPEAAFYDPDRQAENIAQFQKILRLAKGMGIDVVLMQYNIHVSPGFARKHDLGSIKLEAGYGGQDTPLVRRYNRYCLEKLFDTYPDLAGLMIGGELNKDAFDFLETTILPVLRAAASRPALHFRLWGQHFPDQVQALAAKMPRRFVMWHKISKEMISVPQADLRFSRWLEHVPGVPICAITGSGNASAFRHQGRIYADPAFVAKQLEDLRQRGGSGVGLFCGMDNWFYDKDGLAGREDSIAPWMRANWLSRQITGRLAWDLTDCSDDFWVEKLASHYEMPTTDAQHIFHAAVASSRVLPAINVVVGQYGQDLGFCGTLGRFSQQTGADKPGNYRLGGPYAWPLHDWSVEQPDIMQAARSPNQTAKLIDMADKLETECSQAIEDLPELEKGEGLEDFLKYVKLNGYSGPLHTNLFKGATLAYRIAFSDNVDEALQQLKSVVAHLDNACACARNVTRFARQIPLIPIKIREDLPTPLLWGDLWLKRLIKQHGVYTKALTHLESSQSLFHAAQLYWQSHCAYHDAFGWLREWGYHLTPESWEAGRKLVHQSISLAQASLQECPAGSVNEQAARDWLDFLQVEADRLQPRQMEVPVYNENKNSLPAHRVMWHWEGVVSPCTFDDTLLSFFNPGCVEFKLRQIEEGRSFRLAYDQDSLWLALECPRDKVSRTPKVFICNPNPDSIRELEIELASGKVKSTCAHLRAPHGIFFDETVEQDIIIDRSSTSQSESVLMRLPFEILGRSAKLGDTWGFNLLWEHRGLLWSPVCGEFNWLDPSQAGKITFT